MTKSISNYLPEWLETRLNAYGRNAAKIIEMALHRFGFVKGQELTTEQNMLIALEDEPDGQIVCCECFETVSRDQGVCIANPLIGFYCPNCFDIECFPGKNDEVFYLANYHESVTIHLTKEMADEMRRSYADPADFITEMMYNHGFYYKEET